MMNYEWFYVGLFGIGWAALCVIVYIIAKLVTCEHGMWWFLNCKYCMK